jgi:hypothetical protein
LRDPGPLPPAGIESLALLFQTYKLAFTPGLVKDVFGNRVTEGMFLEKEKGGGYVHFLEGDLNWWIPSGKVFYSKDPSLELEFAKAHFFLPYRFEDPFGNSLH